MLPWYMPGDEGATFWAYGAVCITAQNIRQHAMFRQLKFLGFAKVYVLR